MRPMRILLPAAALFAAGLAAASAQVAYWSETFETYAPGQLSGQGGGWISSVASQAIIVNDPLTAPEGDQFLRIFRNASGDDSTVVRVRNPTVRTFFSEGAVTWSMINNNPDAGGRFSFRLPVNSGSSNLFQMEVRHDLQNIRYLQLGSWQTLAFELPTEWTDWRVDFDTSDPSPENHRVSLTVTRRSDQAVLVSLEDIWLANFVAAGWDGIENFYGIDTVSLAGGDLVHDFSIDNIQVIPEPRTYALIAGLLLLAFVLTRRRVGRA